MYLSSVKCPCIAIYSTVKTTVKPAVSILYDSRRNKEGIYTICWNIYFNGRQKPFSTGIKITKSDVAWLKENKNGVDGRNKDPWRRNLWNMVYGDFYIDPVERIKKDSLRKMAERVIETMDVFSFDDFRSRINNYENIDTYKNDPFESKIPDDIIELLYQTAIKLKEDQFGSYSSHMDTRSSLIRYCEYIGREPKLPFREITVSFLEKWEQWMLKYGKAPKAKAHKGNIRDQKQNPEKYQPKPASEATIGVYARYIRKMMLIALGEKLITEDQYPFRGHRSYTIPSVSNVARALEVEHVAQIMQYVPDDDQQTMYRDLWVFSYLCNGINAMDICNLRWAYYDIPLRTIRFFREKTKRTSKGDKREIVIHLFDEAIRIIERWGVKRDGQEFIFPFFKPGMTGVQRKYAANHVVKMINKNMAVVSDKLGLPFRVKSNDARDTQATVLMKAGAPLPFIQSVLGHHDLKTTQKYFGRFSGDQSREMMKVLLP